MNVAIIPARGGSKRIPRKNIKHFSGKPIIAYSIEAALLSGLFDEVMVSTDDLEIKQIAEDYGAKVPFLRSQASSNDFATTFEVLEEVLTTYDKIGKTFENMCCIYPCAPFVTAEILKEGYSVLLENHFDSVIPMVAFSFPIQRAFKAEDKKVSFVHPEFALTRSQDLEKRYHDAGQFYWSRVEALLQTKSLLNSNTGYIELSDLQVQDIDNETDWKLAELKFQLLAK